MHTKKPERTELFHHEHLRKINGRTRLGNRDNATQYSISLMFADTVGPLSEVLCRKLIMECYSYIPFRGEAEKGPRETIQLRKLDRIETFIWLSTSDRFYY